MKISTWRNSYIPYDEQFLFTDAEIGQGENMEQIPDPEKNIQKFADYLNALYNTDKLSCFIKEGKLIITFDPE